LRNSIYFLLAAQNISALVAVVVCRLQTKRGWQENKSRWLSVLEKKKIDALAVYDWETAFGAPPL
jgi:hypothetical protein